MKRDRQKKKKKSENSVGNSMGGRELLGSGSSEGHFRAKRKVKDPWGSERSHPTRENISNWAAVPYGPIKKTKGLWGEGGRVSKYA